MTPRTSSEARRAGSPTYETGNPCRDCGQVAPRWASSRRCTVCMPMDRSPKYVARMRAAFDAAFRRTLHTGYLHVPDHRADGWWILPVREGGGSFDDVPGIEARRVDV